LAERIVGTIADYAITYAFDGTQIRRLGLAHRIEEKRPLMQRLDESGRPGLDDATGAGFVIRTGEPSLAPEITVDDLIANAHNRAHLDALLALAPRSAMVVPMIARGRTVGAIAFATAGDSTRRYRPD